MDEIVKKLRNCGGARNSLKESIQNSKLSEADEEESEELAPDEVPEEDNQEEDTGTSPKSPNLRSVSTIDTEDGEEGEEFVDPDGDTEEENQEEESDEDSTTYVNPLDNPYAIKHTIGDEVILAYANGTTSKLKGQIDGYDKEGFYRILWSNGLTTNGITDLALSDLVKATHESKCVCGHTKFVTEGKYVVCDECGRRIREAADVLTPTPKKDKKGKIIRAEMHPVTTATKPNITETIRNAFKKNVDERYDPDTDEFSEDDYRALERKGIPYQFQRLYKELDNQFWTRLDDLVADIEELGYEVIFSKPGFEKIVVGPGPSAPPEFEDLQYYIPLAGTSRTITLDFSRAELGD